MRSAGDHFEYYYGIEVEQFSFYRIPRLLIKDKRFKRLSSDAKLLYGLMLDRMSSSMKNGWLDAENRVYIHYTIENIMEDLDCAKATAVKIMAECKVCINLHKSMVEVLDSEDDLREEHLVLPTVEELYPYNKCMYDFLGDDIVPKGMSASHYLRAKQIMREFYVYRRSAVVNRLIGWLQAREIEIKYEELCE